MRSATRVPVCFMAFSSHTSAERESERLDARVEEPDLELAVGDGPGLPDQLIQALIDGLSVALGVDVDSMSGAGRFSVDEDPKADGRPSGRGSHYEVKIARVK